ncbi:MAG: glycosyltransferase family 2 protein [bacterium]|nr:glycosyltransferase family 2 protein [bacterium]
MAVVVLNWNGRRLLARCLDSVLASEYKNIRVYLVDNGSSDESQDFVREQYPKVTLIQNHKNLGVAEGGNVGARRALRDGADYIVRLDNDVKVEPGWLGPILEAAQADTTIGLLSPMEWHYDGTQLDHHFHELLREETSYEEDIRKGPLPPLYETKRVLGGAMTMSRSVVQRVGLFDPMYFFGHEDGDLCRRARHHGFRMLVVTGSRISHDSRRVPSHGRTPYINARSTQVYNWKNPEWSIWKKVKFSLGFSKNFTKITGWPMDLHHLLTMAYLQLWVFVHLPGIFWRIRKERRGACYLE